MLEIFRHVLQIRKKQRIIHRLAHRFQLPGDRLNHKDGDFCSLG